jgi:putative aldouronate transport system permease protein
MAKLKSSRPLDYVLIVFFALLSIITLYPFWHCLVGSFISYGEYMQSTLLLWPKEFTLDSYRFVFDQGKIFSPMRVTALITLVGTFINLIITSSMAYGMSKSYPGDKLVNFIVVLTMFVGAGLIPNYMLLRDLKLLNSVWVYIIPSMINTFYLIIMRTNFANFPKEVEEAAIIDGSSETGVFFRIVLPLSKPILATIALFTAVDYWNTYAASVYYVTDAGKKTLQDYLYMLLSDNATNASGMGASAIGSTAGKSAVFSENIKLANTIIAILPIMLVYPFLQKYFTSGIMVGAVKG